ncbi:MAG: zinc ribbon domain-containing protein [Planctomycetaceae bacterium]
MSWDDEFDEDGADSGDDPTPLVHCPNCGGEVYREADSCPHCGEFLIGEDGPLGGKPAWFVALGLLGIVAVLLVLSGLIASL